MEDLEVLWKKLSFLSTKNQLKWNGTKNDLLRFLALHFEVQPNQFRASDNRICAVLKIQNITCNFYHKAKTLQIQGKEEADKLRKDLINLTSTWTHPVSETLNAFQENLDNDVQAREVITTGLFSPSDGSITINRDLKQPRRVCGRRREYPNRVWVENVVDGGKNKYLSKLLSTKSKR